MASSSKKFRVLVVDDSNIEQKIHSALCKKFGCNTQIAKYGKEAVDLFLSNGALFDLVLMDMEMPIMDGPTATKEIRGMGFDTMVVGISSHEGESDRNVFIAAGLNDFHTKPLKADTLKSILEQLSKEMDVSQMMSSSKKLSVLVVGDDAIIQRMCKRVGCEVQAVKNGKEAVDLYQLKGASFDLVLMEMEMPIMDGPSATKELRGMKVESVIVGLSSGDGESERSAFMAAGLTDFHIKPLTIDSLTSSRRISLTFAGFGMFIG